MSAEVRGDKELLSELRRLAKAFPRALSAAVYQEGFSLWNASVKRAPVEYDVLRTSAYVAPPRQEGGLEVVEVGFGTKYAVRQHENTSYRHPRGGEAGYLRKAMDAAQAGYLERLVARTQRNVQEGVAAVALLPAPTRPRAGGGRKSIRRMGAATKRASKRGRRG